MRTFRRLLLVIQLFISLFCVAQVQPCIDVRTIAPNTDAARGVYDFNNKWTPGATIRVSFMDGSDWQKMKVKEYAVLWTRYANIRFEFMKLGTGDVRVSFDKPGSYSFIGTDCRNRSATQETMNLGWINESKTEGQLKSVILHEFGHTLGLLHEHMNPVSTIRWNKPVVYAWYLQYEGWDKEMVDKQVFDRYSVNMTNKSYDPKSIMHYPIPSNFTEDGYSVGENFDLSESDRKLIAELYPKNKTFAPDNRTAKWSKLENVSIEYDVKQGNQTGIRITQDFLIYNTAGNRCIMAVYFYDADNSKPLADKNGTKASADGNVAAYVYFTPSFQSTQYKDLGVFMPYDELELGDGSFRLKCYVALFDPDLKLITSSGYQYFTFSQGVNSPEIKAVATVNDSAALLEVTPIFTLNNAADVKCHIAALFFDEKGRPLRNPGKLYLHTDGIIAVIRDFIPESNQAVYTDELRKNLKLSISYADLSIGKGRKNVQCRLVLYDNNWKKIQSGELLRVQYTYRARQ
jgi:hypothetical protein